MLPAAQSTVNTRTVDTATTHQRTQQHELVTQMKDKWPDKQTRLPSQGHFLTIAKHYTAVPISVPKQSAHTCSSATPTQQQKPVLTVSICSSLETLPQRSKHAKTHTVCQVTDRAQRTQSTNDTSCLHTQSSGNHRFSQATTLKTLQTNKSAAVPLWNKLHTPTQI